MVLIRTDLVRTNVFASAKSKLTSGTRNHIFIRPLLPPKDHNDPVIRISHNIDFNVFSEYPFDMGNVTLNAHNQIYKLKETEGLYPWSIGI